MVGWVMGIAPRDVIDYKTGEIRSMSTVLILAELEDGTKQRIVSAATILVGQLSEAISRGEIIPGSMDTPIKITYMGLVRTKYTGKNAADWRIERLYSE